MSFFQKALKSAGGYVSSGVTGPLGMSDMFDSSLPITIVTGKHRTLA